MSSDFEFYRDLPKKKRNFDEGSVELGNMGRITEAYSRACESSIASESVQPVERKRNKTVKVSKPLLVLATVAVIAVSAVATLGITKSVEIVENRTAISEFREDIGADDALEDAYWSRMDVSGRVYGYNQNTLAEYVRESDNPDMALFGVYNGISQERISNMNEVVSRYNSEYLSWDDYLVKKGFVDKNGNPSNDVYKSAMTELVKADQTIEKTESNHGIKR